MQRLLMVVLLLVLMPLTAQEMSSMELATELSEILNDYEIAYQEISQAQERQELAWNDLRQQVSDLECSFSYYKTEIETEIVKIIVDLEKKHRAEIRALKISNWMKVGIGIAAGVGITYLIVRIAK